MTALALTPQPATGSVQLAITAAPDYGTAVYSQGFEAGLDSWAGSTAQVTLTRPSGGAAGGTSFLRATAAGNLGVAVAFRNLTGLTVGHRYRASAWLRQSTSDGVRAQVAIASVPSPLVLEAGVWTLVTLEFVATATTHTLFVQNGTNPRASSYVIDLDDVRVQRIPTAASSLTRVDANGAAVVRLQDGQEPIGGVMTVVDYEPALSGPVRYDLVDESGAITATTALTGQTGPRLHVPVTPQVRSDPQMLVREWADDRETRHTVHEVIDRDDSPVTLGRTGLRTGRLQLLHTTEATALATRAVAASSEVFMLRLPNLDATDLYAVATRSTLRSDGRRWLVDVDYLEVANPAGPLQGAVGWTWAALSSRASWAAVRSTFATWTAVAVGP